MHDNGHIDPALAALDLISQKLPADRTSVLVEELFQQCDALSAEEFRDGLRILIERGVVRFVPVSEGEGARISIT